eukprot:1427293-Amphidinium_carterae.1
MAELAPKSARRAAQEPETALSKFGPLANAAERYYPYNGDEEDLQGGSERNQVVMVEQAAFEGDLRELA